jgi:predicted DNA-binding protein (MmcQ/YjbR family)
LQAQGKKLEDPALARIRALCLSLPETSEAGSWGHPNFRAGRRTFVTYEWLKSGATIAFRLNPVEVTRYEVRPGFVRTPYGQGQWVSMVVQPRVDWTQVKQLALRSYRMVALKRMIAALDGGASASSSRTTSKSKTGGDKRSRASAG